MVPRAVCTIKTACKYLLRDFKLTKPVLYAAQASQPTHERSTFVPTLISNLEKINPIMFPYFVLFFSASSPTPVVSVATVAAQWHSVVFLQIRVLDRAIPQIFTLTGGDHCVPDIQIIFLVFM